MKLSKVTILNTETTTRDVAVALNLLFGLPLWVAGLLIINISVTVRPGSAAVTGRTIIPLLLVPMSD
jgi:uncharacterized membrane protein